LKLKTHRERTRALSIFILLAVTLVTSLYTPKVLAEVSITQISPNTGFVGTLVTLTGQIATENGSYKVFFGTREIRNGTANQTTVSTTFTVPNSTFGKQLIRLHDAATGENSTTVDFQVRTHYTIRALEPGHPQQIQESANVTIVAIVTGGNATALVNGTLTVTDPNNVDHSVSNVSLPVVQDGYGEMNWTYPAPPFDNASSTFFVGTYKLKLDMANVTLATGSIKVGLTNATEYHRFQTVAIQAANYTTSDLLTVRITHINETFELPASNASGPLGIVTATWTVPANASLGSYKVEVANTRSQTQNFTVVSKNFTCEVRTLNLNNEVVKGVLVEAWNATSPPIVDSNTTNANGTTRLNIEATDYIFKAFWNTTEKEAKAQVGQTSWISVGASPGDRVGVATINITCSLAHIWIAVENAEGAAVPSVEVNASFTYTTRLGTPATPTPLSRETDLGGTAVFRNMYTNVTYTIKASRYDQPFATVANNLTATTWLNMTCPLLQLAVKVYDRTGVPLQDAQVEVYEWSMGLSGLVGTKNTGTTGEVAFNATFGKYVVDTYRYGMLANHTTVLLINQPTTLSVHVKLYSLTLSVNVVDYLGLGIPNANVTLEREGETHASSNTGSNGAAKFTDLVGGNYRILVSVGGKLYTTTTMYLEDPQTVSTKLASLVSIGGFTIETSTFLTAVLVALLLVVLVGVLLYRRLRSRQKED
jgi:protocatechuate 3,4-dioxygenase beta subunit